MGTDQPGNLPEVSVVRGSVGVGEPDLQKLLCALEELLLRRWHFELKHRVLKIFSMGQKDKLDNMNVYVFPFQDCWQNFC